MSADSKAATGANRALVLARILPNAVLLTYPNAGHGSLFQYPESFTRHATAFLDSNSNLAPY